MFCLFYLIFFVIYFLIDLNILNILTDLYLFQLEFLIIQ